MATPDEVIAANEQAGVEEGNIVDLLEHPGWKILVRLAEFHRKGIASDRRAPTITNERLWRLLGEEDGIDWWLKRVQVAAKNKIHYHEEVERLNARKAQTEIMS